MEEVGAVGDSAGAEGAGGAVMEVLTTVLVKKIVKNMDAMICRVIFKRSFDKESLDLLARTAQELVIPKLLSILIISVTTCRVYFGGLEGIYSQVRSTRSRRFRQLSCRRRECKTVLRYVGMITRILYVTLLKDKCSVECVRSKEASLMGFLATYILFLVYFFCYNVTRTHCMGLLRGMRPRGGNSVTSGSFRGR